MILLSIDVGIRNLALCLMDHSTKRILQWDVGGVPTLSDDGIYECMNRHLKNRPWVLSADTILIERQPDKNRKIKSVENFLHAYFVIHDKKTILYDAKHKVPDIVGPGKVRYRQRKNASIERCRAFIRESNSHLVQFFETHDKKDDLADTVMQALSYNPAPAAPKQQQKKKVVPRKPTCNQKETRYSKANLAWLFKNKQHSTDKRFTKDLLKYYTCLDELIAEMA